MSLLQKLSYRDYKYASTLNAEQCEVIARLAGLRISFNDVKKPGELLIKQLDRRGYSDVEYKKFLNTTQNNKTIFTYYKPQSKIAILIANDKYEHLSKLATPSVDCDALASALSELGFICIIIKNTISNCLKTILYHMISVIPKDSYCLIFYAGHGCELCNTKCILGVSCPPNDMEFEHCVTENWILREVAKCEPDLCILIMDMCRVNLDKTRNQQIYASLSSIEEYSIHNNLIIGYSTQSSKAAYEVLQIECSTTIDNNITYELKPGDTDKIVPCASQYVSAMCERLTENCDVATLFDKIHLDVEKSIRKQRPIKVQCGVFKRSLYDPVQGDAETDTSTQDTESTPTPPPSASISEESRPSDDYAGRRKKVKKIGETVGVAEALNRLQNISCAINNRNTEDEFHFFGLNVASQLRQLPLYEALGVQNEIQAILSRARRRNMYPILSVLPNSNTQTYNYSLID